MSSSPPTSWRNRAPVILPLVLLQSMAETFSTMPTFHLFREIACDKLAAHTPPDIPEPDVCNSPEIPKILSQNMAYYLLIATVFSIIFSGPYGRLSDLFGRKRTMRLAASIQFITCLWLLLICEALPVVSPYNRSLILYLGGSIFFNP